MATCAARLGEHDQASAYAAEAVRLKPHFTIAAYVMTLPYKDEADRVRETGPALEGMYQFMTWLVPAGEKLPRSQKFWPYGAGRCAWGRPGTVVMRRPLWSFGEARRAPVLPHPGSSFDRRTSPLSSGFNAPVAGHGLLVQTAARWLTPSWWSWRTRWVNRNGTVFGSIATGAVSSPCRVFSGDLSILTVPSRHADVYKLALMPMR